MFEIFDVYPGGKDASNDATNTLKLFVATLAIFSFVASFLVIVLQAGGCQNMRPEFRKYAARFPDASWNC